MSNCRSCHAEIRWHKTKNGKNLPLDPDLVPPDTKGAVECSDGHRISHWATCPNADEHRAANTPPAANTGHVQPWVNGPWRAFDLETTGKTPTTDRILTAALVDWTAGASQFDDGDQRHWLANPGVPIDPEAFAKHGISDDHAQTHGYPPADVVDDVTFRLGQDWHRDGVTVVAFCGHFDLTMLDAELHRHHRRRLQLGPLLDPFRLDKHYDKWRKGSRKLEALAQHYDVKAGTAHDATGDCLTTLRVLRAIITAYPEIQTLDLGQLWEIQKASYLDGETYFARKENRRPDPRWPIASAA